MLEVCAAHASHVPISGDGDGSQHFVTFEGSGEQVLEELVCFYIAVAIRTCNGESRIQGCVKCWLICGRICVCETPTHCASIAHLLIGDQRGRLSQDRTGSLEVL